MRTLIAANPFAHLDLAREHWGRGIWPASWVTCAEAGPTPHVTAFRRRFALAGAATVRVHVSADERYELFLDGVRIGRGSERGHGDAWHYETYDLPLAAGDHVLVARTWAFGALAPFAQISRRPGFLLAAQEPHGDLLSTGVAAWDAKRLTGYAITDPGVAWGTGGNVIVDGATYPWGVERGEGGDWLGVVVAEPAIDRDACMEYPRAERQRDGRWRPSNPDPTHLLTPATLPPMRDELFPAGAVRLVSAITAGAVRAIDAVQGEDAAWRALLAGGAAVELPPATRRRVLIDVGTYVCAYPELVLSGGRDATIHVRWAEALYHEPDARTKGDRAACEGKWFVGVGDGFIADGGERRAFAGLWWQAGRWIEIIVETAGAPLRIDAFALRETRYPLELESSFACDDPRYAGIIPIAARGVQMCAHETYFDCPYYEQLMYIGDTRLQVLVTHVMTRDARLPLKALQLFERSRLHDGLTQSRSPSRCEQVIPPFSLWWVAMLRDHAAWRGDADALRELMPSARGVLDAFLRLGDDDGLPRAPRGWNFQDWVPGWASGIAPGGDTGISSVLAWQLVLALGHLAEVEAWLGEPELAARWRRIADDIGAAADRRFWVEARGLYADDATGASFSEHAQCLALLGGRVPVSRRARVADALFADAGLARTTIYFSHYLFEACALLGRVDRLQERLGLWFDLPSQGFATPFESPEPSRSDCHGWGAHPLFHLFATILGIRPTRFGFAAVEIAPQLGALRRAEGRLVHPAGGVIAVALRIDGDGGSAQIELPPGVPGVLRWRGQERALEPGRHVLRLS